MQIFISFNRGFESATQSSAIWSAFWDQPSSANGPILIEPLACTEELRHGLNIWVASESDDSDINTCDATVSATEGTYSEVLTPLSTQSRNAQCLFVGAEERAGNYTINIQLKDHLPQSIYSVVREDLCHVIPTTLRNTLAVDKSKACSSNAEPALLTYIELRSAGDPCAAEITVEAEDQTFSVPSARKTLLSDNLCEYSVLDRGEASGEANLIIIHPLLSEPVQTTLNIPNECDTEPGTFALTIEQ